jgi:hypothetical protein
MSFHDVLRRIFGRSAQHELLLSNVSPLADATGNSRPNFSSAVEAEIASHLVEVKKEAVLFSERYGSDFNAFLYRLDIDYFIRREVLLFRNSGSQFNHFLDYSHWADRHYLNFPGPFYTGESDTCGTGECEAPNNVLNDGPHAQEYVFRQPQNYTEFLCLVDAAAVEVFDSYSCDGNQYWTYKLCQEWWRGKSEIIRRLRTPAFQKCNGDRIQLYISYLNSTAEIDLKKYCYFLENGAYPTNDKSLPPL